MRDGAVSCLMKLPAPLPGLETPEALIPHLHWACHLLHSPRVRESDAGTSYKHNILCAINHNTKKCAGRNSVSVHMTVPTLLSMKMIVNHTSHQTPHSVHRGSRLL